MNQDTHTPLEDKIDTVAAEAGATPEAAADTTVQSVKGLIEQHPIAMLAGGILIGALIASAIPRRRSGAPVQTAAGNLGKQASRLAAVGAQLATAYAARAAQAGREGSEKLEDLGGMISETSGEAKRRTGEMADVAATAFRELSAVALRHAGEIAARIKR
jgi:hypothetical protein